MLEQLYEYGIFPAGIIHVGAHEGQEYKYYLESGIIRLIFFEPVKSNFLRLLDTIQYSPIYVQCYQIALGNYSGRAAMNIETENRGMSCSILEPAEHLNQYPWIEFRTKEIVDIDKLDNIKFIRKHFNILNIDVQGYELEVLKGSEKTLKFIDAIFTEVNIKEMYKNCALISDLDQYLSHQGFTRITEQPQDSWGEAVYIKNKFVNK